MFERFTERARQVVVLAQAEAAALKHNYIGTEHILLGLLREEDGLAARVLESIGIDIEEVRTRVRAAVAEGDELVTGQIPFTPRAKRVLELALREALSLGHNYLSTEHVLLGLARENNGVAARVLESFGADADLIRDRILHALGGEALQPIALEHRAVRVDDVDEWADASHRSDASTERRPLLLAIGLAAAGFPLGLLAGWLIWG